ncbi:type II toxin-antitoxin system HipA family toxin [Pseudomonas aeruginosa]|uniref:type II toxin-antitoxin system HipA family toxin n=1 Tax=Pseudomonas aeruginosa TaxID=287 RepID=UPI0015615FBD|nr:type II toxin-antitoxin system HipA family toxin [Stutzerimonas stutzeri]
MRSVRSALKVNVPEGESGTLIHTPERFLFRYSPEARPEMSIAFGMPVRLEEYATQSLMPIFQMNLPEGFLLEQIRNRLAKAARIDPMLLLAITGANDPIGRIDVEAPEQLVRLLGSERSDRGESLDEILAWDGSEDLFAALVDKYVLRSGISGIQPKLLVPEIEQKATATTSELIIKSEGRDYPHLAINEFLCMSIAREAGLEVPEFHLSRNYKMFIMRRFDRVDGKRLGFEDMAVLTGKGTEQKYQGSYEMLARAIRLYCPPDHVQASLEALYRSVVVSCIVGNGDAHLKNFGLLYSNPESNDSRLAPAYDIVNTTAYIPEDSLALELGGNKSLFASRLGLMNFAQVCEVKNPRGVIEQTLTAVETVMKKSQHLTEVAPEIATAITKSFHQFDLTFARSQASQSNRGYVGLVDSSDEVDQRLQPPSSPA